MKKLILLILITIVFSSMAAAQNNPPAEVRKVTTSSEHGSDEDSRALIEMENAWLKSEHDRATLERILASDFIHPVATGDFLSKEQHIYYSTKYLPPANLHNRFESLKVRIYDIVGIVNGLVVTSDENGKEVNRTVFTDVFAKRDGRWQAINAQENKVEQLQRPR